MSIHGLKPWNNGNLENSLTFAVMYVEDKEKYKVAVDSYIYIAINMHWEAHEFELPIIPEGKVWHLYSDTNITGEGNCTDEDVVLGNQQNLFVPERSIIIIIGR